MGDTDITRSLDGTSDRYGVRAGLIYGRSTSNRFFSGAEEALNDSMFRLDLQLLTVVAAIEAPWGGGLGVVLPMGSMRRVEDANRSGLIENVPGATPEDTLDQNIGDLEVRARQDVFRPFALTGSGLPRVVVSLGAALPTGEFIPYANVIGGGQKAPPKTDTYVALGRGVSWLLADLEVMGSLAFLGKAGELFGYYAALSTRTALGETENGFAWGPEVRTGAGLSVRAVPGWLTAAVNADWQWRGISTEMIYDTEAGRPLPQVYISGGGDWYDLSPSLRLEAADYVPGLAATVTARFPLYRDVHGKQGVQNTGVFLGLQYAFAFGGQGATAVAARPQLRAAQPGDAPVAPEIASRVLLGRVTLVDYWATWCAPCVKLGEDLDTFARERPDVAVARVDATEWLQPEMDRLLPAVPGLPVLDVYGSDGRLLVRLVGPDALAFRGHVPAATPP